MLQEINQWLKQHSMQVLPKSAMGKAIGYMLGQWSKLEAYTRGGRLEIDKAGAWLKEQEDLPLPATHFLLTITLPAELRRLAYQQQRLIYSILMRSGACARMKLARDPKFVGGKIAMLAVLQTWTWDLCYHSYVHFIVPGGGVSQEGKRWLTAQRD